MKTKWRPKSHRILYYFLILAFCNPVFCCPSRFSFDDANCLLFGNQKMKCFGENDFGQLGYEDIQQRGDNSGELGNYLPFVDLGNVSIFSLHVGIQSSCAHLSNLSLKCFGRGDLGQLGLGNTNNMGDGINEMGMYIPYVDLGMEFVLDVDGGGYHSLAKSTSGQVKAWGFNNKGQLGYGDTEWRGDNAGEMGSYLPIVNLGNEEVVIQSMKLGQFFSCVLLSNPFFQMKCWGENGSGQLGQGFTSDIGDNPQEMSVYLPYIQFPEVIELIDSFGVGWYHVGIISSTGSLFTFGENSRGQLGLGHSLDIGNQPNEMGNYLQNVEVGTGRTVVGFYGGYHSCVILDNFILKCFGFNDEGQLGYGDTSTRGNLANQMGDYLFEVNLRVGITSSSVHLGDFHTCVVILNDDSLKCFGRNDSGQLGIGNTDDQGDDSNEMGDYLSYSNLGDDINIVLCFIVPTFSPTFQPSSSPSFSPSSSPSFSPSYSPIFSPTYHPTYQPTLQPTITPTYTLSSHPTIEITNHPTINFRAEIQTSSSTSGSFLGWLIGFGIFMLFVFIFQFLTCHMRGFEFFLLK